MEIHNTQAPWPSVPSLKQPTPGTASAENLSPVAETVLPEPAITASPSTVNMTLPSSATSFSFLEETPTKTSVPQARQYLQQVAQGNPAVMKRTASGQLCPPEVHQTQPLRTEQERERADRFPFRTPYDNTKAHLMETLIDLRREHPSQPVDLAEAQTAFDQKRKKARLDELVARGYHGGPIVYAPYHMQDMKYTLATDAVFREALSQANPDQVAAATQKINQWLGFRSLIVTDNDEKRALNLLNELPAREFFAVLEQETDYELLEDLIAGKQAQPVLDRQIQALVESMAAPGLDAGNLKTYVQKYWQDIRRWGVSSYQPAH